MKVLGKTKDGFIVEMSREEMADMSGNTSTYSNEFNAIDVGSKVKVCSVFNEAREIVGVYEKIKSSVKIINTGATRIIKHLEKVKEDETD